MVKAPVVGKAFSMIHSGPADNWSVKRLAQGAVMSTSRFSARSTAALDDIPMAYVTKRRMNIAGRRLLETRHGIAEIAADVGYENVAVFARGSKRHLGMTLYSICWAFYRDAAGFIRANSPYQAGT